jgi:JmjC domain
MTTAPTPAGTRPTPDPGFSSTTSPLARLVGDADGFLSEHLGVRPHLWHGGDYGDLLSLPDVDEQLTRRALRRPVVRLVRDGEPLDPSTWTSRARTGNTWIDDAVDPGRALGLFAEGATIVLQSLQRWWPPLTAFCDDLAAALGHPVQANAYLSPAGSAGLAPHHDTHDVFVVQLHGTKRWVVREPLIEAPLRRQRSDPEQAARQPVVLEVDLAAGDCLYLPRGFVHSAVAQDDVSLHATVGVLAATALDVVRSIVDRAADEPAFRRMLPVGYAGDERTAAGVVDDVVLELVTWLKGLDRDAVANDLVTRAARQRPTRLHGHLLDIVGSAGTDDRTVVAARAGVVAEVGSDGEHVRVVLRDRTIVLPAELEATARVLLDGAPHEVGELGDRLDEPSRRVLVRRLLREGVLRIVRDA